MNRYRDSLNYKDMEALHSKTAYILDLISDIQLKMVQESEGDPDNPAVNEEKIVQTETGEEIQYRLLTEPFHPAPVKNFLMLGSNSRRELENALAEYSNYINSLTKGEEFKGFRDLLESATYFPENNPEVRPISLMSGLHSLELLKNGLLTVESNILRVVTER